MSNTLRFLRPFLQQRARPTSQAASSTYLSFYHTARFYSTEQASIVPRVRITHDNQGGKYSPEQYPRITPQKGVIDYQTFKERYKDLVRGGSGTDKVIVRGMFCFRI